MEKLKVEGWEGKVDGRKNTGGCGRREAGTCPPLCPACETFCEEPALPPCWMDCPATCGVGGSLWPQDLQPEPHPLTLDCSGKGRQRALDGRPSPPCGLQT